MIQNWSQDPELICVRVCVCVCVWKTPEGKQSAGAA